MTTEAMDTQIALDNAVDKRADLLDRAKALHDLYEHVRKGGSIPDQANEIDALALISISAHFRDMVDHIAGRIRQRIAREGGPF